MNKTMKILTESECQTLLTTLKNPNQVSSPESKNIRNYLIALLMLDAGLRVGEVVSLQVGNLFIMDEPVGMIRVITEKQKTKRTRDIPVTVRLDDAIKEYAEREWLPELRVPRCPCFLRPDTTSPISTRQIERIIRKAANGSLHKDVHPHILRHTFATRLMATCSVRVVQQLLGHASIQSTQVYMHPNSKDLQKAIDTLNDSRDPENGKDG